MTAAPARGASGRQPDIPALSCTPLSSRDDDPSIHPLPTSAHTTSPPVTLTTPQRGRLTNRYPDSLGRVPLHRRGTSNTYERLEDLLREAGYKETRVFTPETDRVAALSVAKKHAGGAGNGGMRGSVGAVVDFITGLVNRGSSLAREAPVAHSENGGASSDVHAWTPPPSPLARTLQVKDGQAKRVASRTSLSRHGSSESMRRRISHVDLSPEDASQRHHVHEVHRSSRGLPHCPNSYLRVPHQHHHNIHHHPVNNYSSKSASTKPNQSNARAYLRHMASAPNIQPLVKRPSLSEASLRSHALRYDHRKSSRRTFILNDDESIAESDHGPQSHVPTDENGHQVHPPLPRNWMESVAKALLSGVGGPAVVVSDAASTRTTKTASTRNSCALSDKSNKKERGRTPARGANPPLLCVQVQDVKARTSEGQVSCTRVMCRSTPTSRGNSRVRGGAQGDRRTSRSGGKRREGDKPRDRGRTKGRDAGVVPSLARTKAENDGWIAPRHRYASGWGMEGSAQAYQRGMWSDDSDDDDEEDEDEEDDEGELGLDRLLVPARRQHSIQSLRKHLQRHPSRVFSGHTTSPRSGRASPFGGAPAGRLDWGDVSWGASRGRKWLASQGEEGENGHSYVFSGSEMGSSRSSTRWRRGLPGLAQWTTST